MNDIKNLLLGLDDVHIVDELPEGVAKPIHRDIVEPFLALQADAKTAGFDLQIASGYRDFSRQYAIWTAKTNGERPLYDELGQSLEFASLNSYQLLQAIMRWSALPGASRHHWGTDVDVYDAAAVDKDFQIQLTDEEVYGSGPFTALHDWLDTRIALNQCHGFFRPYTKARYEQCQGGVSPERWHLSYAPLAADLQRQLQAQCLFEVWENNHLSLLDDVKSDWDDIWKKYIWINAEYYPESYQEILR